ncbi:unnamed protein product [Cyclocybe aegerita]|uniref:Uncharacterized protein n=1 Tax=Cyclocybe aegerita TaxID=1973307 RepID=A0A8S0VZ87_CYCAE|nr:unnamed protein product [Cyclocybe aegerita]
MIPWNTRHRLRDVVDVLHNTSVEIFESKKMALEEGDEVFKAQLSQGKDILSILMRDDMAASKEDKLADKELLGQMSTLTFAAMDTTSGALLQPSSWYSDIPPSKSRLPTPRVYKPSQRALNANRVLTTNHHHCANSLETRFEKLGNRMVTYSTMSSFLSPTWTSSYRLTKEKQYPPVSVVNRTTREDVVLPPSKPIVGLDGREISDIPIPKNTNVIVGIMASNRNAEIWGPDSYEWKPERLLQPLPESVAAAHIPGIYSNL